MSKKEIMKLAKKVEAHLNTERAEEYGDLWYKLADEMEKAYERGEITAEEFDNIALDAFWEFPGELKNGYELDEM